MEKFNFQLFVCSKIYSIFNQSCAKWWISLEIKLNIVWNIDKVRYRFRGKEWRNWMAAKPKSSGTGLLFVCWFFQSNAKKTQGIKVISGHWFADKVCAVWNLCTDFVVEERENVLRRDNIFVDVVGWFYQNHIAHRTTTTKSALNFTDNFGIWS